MFHIFVTEAWIFLCPSLQSAISGPPKTPNISTGFREVSNFQTNWEWVSCINDSTCIFFLGLIQLTFKYHLRCFKILFEQSQDCKGQTLPCMTSPFWHCDHKPLLHKPTSTWRYNERRRFFRIAVGQENKTNNVDEMRCLAVIFSTASSAGLNYSTDLEFS